VDLDLLIRALWRQRWIMLAGTAVATVLALAAYVNLDPFNGHFLEHRQPNKWASSVTMQLTQPGFPEGRVSLRNVEGGDSAQLASLALLYPRLANTDAVRAKMPKPIYGRIDIETISTADGDPLPLIKLTAVTSSKHWSFDRVRHQARAFSSFIRSNQERHGVPIRQRIQLETVIGPTKPALAVQRSKTLPILVFLSMLIATVALALVIENRRRDKPNAASTPNIAPVVEAAPTSPFERGDAAVQPIASQRLGGAPRPQAGRQQTLGAERQQPAEGR